MTEYVVLISGDERRWWDDMTGEQAKAAYAEHGRFSEELEKRGHKITKRPRIGHANCIEVDPATRGFRAVADTTRAGGKAAAY